MNDPRGADAIEAAKARIFGLTEPVGSPSPTLLDSWRRSRDALGLPANVRDVPHVGEELLDSHLLEMVRSPLQRFAERLDGTGLGLLLSDAGGRILERWVGDRSAADHFDKVGTFRGSVLSEDTVGTNGVGTALASRRLVLVNGVEHFAEFYQNAVCTGAPLLHPLTGNMLGSVTLSCDVSPRSELLPPFLRTIIDQLRQHIIEIETPSSRQALEGFLRASEQHSEPVVALGPNGLVIQNALASRLSATQVEEIQEACREAGGPEGRSIRVATSTFELEVTSLSGENHVAVVLERGPARPGRSTTARRTALVGRTPEWLAVLQQVARWKDEATPVVIWGEAGTGKLSVALGRPNVERVTVDGTVVADAAESHLAGTQSWLTSVSAHLDTGARLVIRGAETLNAAAVAGLRSVLSHTSNSAAPILTMTSADPDDADALAVRMGGGRIVHLPALRDRAADLPELWNSFAAEAAPGAGMILRQDALAVLRAHPWNGNLTELRTMVSQLARSGRTGPVGIADLPGPLRESGPSMTLIEQMEIRAIRQALQEAGGNRARAAEILGVSRATVYRKMKAYRLVV